MRRCSSSRTATVVSTSFGAWLDDASQASEDVYPAPDAVCNYCDCSTSPPSLLKDHYRGPLRSRDHLSSYIRRQILASYCRRIAMSSSASYALINTRRRPEELVAWNLTSLRLGLPTTYLFTKTHPTSKTGARRGDYLRRHTEAINRFQANRTMYGYEDGARGEDRQLLYIVVEDSPFIQSDLVRLANLTDPLPSDDSRRSLSSLTAVFHSSTSPMDRPGRPAD
jgi:hypothetical protein